jgi:hypothetical protein
MRICFASAVFLAFSAASGAQKPSATQAPPGSVTVPATIDHNRVFIDVDIPTSNGTTERVRAWIDTANPDLFVSARVAQAVSPTSACEGQFCTITAPPKVFAGDFEISFDGVKTAGFPIGSAAGSGRTTVIPGVKAEINLPSTVLRHYDVLIDFPDRKVTIGTPGSIHFNGVSAKVQIDPETGVITVPGKIDNKKYALELDLGSPMSSLSSVLFDALAAAHPDWPHMTGTVGPASNFLLNQTKTSVMRLDRLQFGPLFLTNVAVQPLPPESDRMAVPARLEKMAGAGSLGSEALQNYRVGIDYAHSTIYFDLGRTYTFPDFDVIGVVLSAGWDGVFTILGVADIDGNPSVVTGPDGVQPGDHLIAVDAIPVLGSTMGQVWSMLGGTPGQERRLTIERAGKQITISATVQHFLGESEARDPKKKR